MDAIVVSGRWQVGGKAASNNAVCLACFPARGLPQSGSKGLSQSSPFRPNTPSECRATLSREGVIIGRLALRARTRLMRAALALGAAAADPARIGVGSKCDYDFQISLGALGALGRGAHIQLLD